MRRITVPLPGATYDVIVGRRLLPQLGALLENGGRESPIAVVSDERVAALYAPVALEALNRAGQRAALVTIPEGETTKTLATVERLYRAFSGLTLDRGSLVVALGGGVVGDVAGFAAASYLRGIDLVQVPTTLLAQVDASIGGKTGVDLPEGKNLVGAFHQPRLVVADLDLLATLPAAELRSGLAEVIKYGAIAEPELLTELELRRDAVVRGEAEALAGLVSRSAAIKAAVVAGDEREAGRRAILNFGHTLGHALEAATGYGEYLHGEAVAIGMVAAARLSVRLTGLAPAAAARLEAVIAACGLPAAPRAPVSTERVLAAARLDKKARGGALRFVLLRAFGAPEVRPVDEELARMVWESLRT
jgi:3-dehydroquinate synthase